MVVTDVRETRSRRRGWLVAGVWPVVGAAALILQAYVFARWLLSGPISTDPGPDPLPDYSRYGIIAFQIAMVLLGIGGLAYIGRTLWARQRLNIYQLVMVGWLFTWWQDPLVSMARRGFTYNSHLVNAGCWCNYVPGWTSESGSSYVEPLLITPAAYLVVLPTGAFMSAWFMRLASKRWPKLNGIGVFVLGWAGATVLFQFPLEFIATRLIHVDVWLGSPASVSLWGNNFYKMPIFEFPLFALALATTGWMVYKAQKDNGRSWVDRQLDDVSVSGSRRSALRMLGVIGYANFSNMIYIVLFVIISIVFESKFPDDTPSWLLYGRY